VHAVQLDDKNHKAEFMLAVIDILKNDNEAGAKTHLERALAIDPENPHYLLHYGVVLMEHNDREGAAAVLERRRRRPFKPADPLQPRPPSPPNGGYARARTELEMAVRLRPELARAYYQLASVYRALGETAKAKQATDRFLKFKDQDRTMTLSAVRPAYAFGGRPPQ
jgi:Tfp pilus assembly protein PilF